MITIHILGLAILAIILTVYSRRITIALGGRQ